MPDIFAVEDLLALRQQFQASFGCGVMDLMRYEYTAYNTADDGPTWAVKDVLYIHLQWPPSGAVGVMAAQPQAQPQMMMTPSGMVMVAAPPPQQGMMMGQQPVMYVSPVMAPQTMAPQMKPI